MPAFPYKVFSISPELENAVLGKIRSFGSFENGWDFGEGVPAPFKVVDMALDLCRWGEELGFEMDAFPGAGGDISIDFYAGDELVQILINTDLSFELTHESGIGYDYEEVAHSENILIEELKRYLVDFKARRSTGSCSLFERSTPTSTGSELGVSIKRFSGLIRMEGFLSSTKPVLGMALSY
jgi:hypothetical protein